jgi:hypothetical protein
MERISSKFAARNLAPLAIGVLVLALAAPILAFARLKAQLLGLKERQVRELEENIAVVPRIMNMSKGYIVGSDGALRNLVKLNIVLSEPPADPARAYENRAAALSLAKNVLDAARKYPRLVRDPAFIRLNNRFEEISGSFWRAHAECLEKSGLLLKVASLPVYGRFLRADMDDICADNGE